jgi:hypothetical protein
MNEASRQFLADVQGKLSQYFSGEEIETMAFVLGIDYDSLRGGTKPTKVNSLIADLARRGRLVDLIAEARKQRGNVTWPDVPPNFELPQGAAGSETDGATIYQIGTLNTAGGAFIGGGITAGGDVNAGQKSVAGDEVGGSKYVMSGDFRGAMLNIESRLDNVTQTIGGAPAVSPDQKEQLSQAVAQLKQMLGRISPEQLPDAEALARRVSALADEAIAPNPDREAVVELGEIVRRAAGKLAGSAPGVVALVATIVELVESIVR